jgi:hypothetical protein
LKEIGRHNDDEPKVKEFKFIKETQILPIFLPLFMTLESRVANFIALALSDSCLVFEVEVLFRNEIYLSPS